MSEAEPTLAEMLEEMQSMPYDAELYNGMIDYWQQDWDTFTMDDKASIFELMTTRPELDENNGEIFDRNSADKWDRFADHWYNNAGYNEKQAVSDRLTPMTEEPLGANGRTFVKNFVDDPYQALEELRAQNPDLQNIRWRNGRIVGQKKGENFDRVLDPEFGEWSDTPRDIADAAYTALEVVAPAVVQGLTTYATGGNVLAGTAMGSAVAGGLDTLEQYIKGAPSDAKDGGPHEYATLRDYDPARTAISAGGHALGGTIGPLARRSKGFVPGMGKAAAAGGAMMGGPLAGKAMGKAADMLTRRQALKEAGKKVAAPTILDYRGNPFPASIPPIPTRNIWQDVMTQMGTGVPREWLAQPPLEPPPSGGGGMSPRMN